MTLTAAPLAVAVSQRSGRSRCQPAQPVLTCTSAKAAGAIRLTGFGLDGEHLALGGDRLRERARGETGVCADVPHDFPGLVCAATCAAAHARRRGISLARLRAAYTS